MNWLRVLAPRERYQCDMSQMDFQSVHVFQQGLWVFRVLKAKYINDRLFQPLERSVTGYSQVLKHWAIFLFFFKQRQKT